MFVGGFARYTLMLFSTCLFSFLKNEFYNPETLTLLWMKWPVALFKPTLTLQITYKKSFQGVLRIVSIHVSHLSIIFHFPFQPNLFGQASSQHHPVSAPAVARALAAPYWV